MKQFISFIVTWLIALNIFMFFMGGAVGSESKDCHIGKTKRWEYVLPSFRLGCNSVKYFREFGDWSVKYFREFGDWMGEEVQ